MEKDTLYLGSQSSARQHLLRCANISYAVLSHQSDEVVDSAQSSFEQYVLAIAQHKMQMLLFPDQASVSKEYLFAVTADTLVRSTKTGEVLGKPKDYAQAAEMLAIERAAPVEVMTGCCVGKFYYEENTWKQAEAVHWTTGAVIEFYVESDVLDQYFSAFPFILHCSGAGMVEDHGLSYLKSIQGSYTAVMGLPLYELRQVLKQLGFVF